MATDYSRSRCAMVDSQIRTNKVTDERLIAALRSVERERFVAPEQRGVAYLDDDLPLGADRFLNEPMVFARLVQAAQITAAHRVLDIGCATGYSTVVLAHLAAHVCAVESDPACAADAAVLIPALAPPGRAVFKVGSLGSGAPEHAPFDAIVIEGAVAGVPARLTDQLAERGRLVAVVRNGRRPGHATVIERRGADLSSRVLFDASSPLLPGFAAEAGFVF